MHDFSSFYDILETTNEAIERSLLVKKNISKKDMSKGANNTNPDSHFVENHLDFLIRDFTTLATKAATQSIGVKKKFLRLITIFEEAV